MRIVKIIGGSLLVLSMFVNLSSVAYAQEGIDVANPAIVTEDETVDETMDEIVDSIMARTATKYSYSGIVSKTSDYETAYKYKNDTSGSAINQVSIKPSGTFVSWVETTTGSNCTSKKSYTSTGKYTMTYVNSDMGSNVGKTLYDDQYKLKLNISTTLTNFTSGSVEGLWSPDTY